MTTDQPRSFGSRLWWIIRSVLLIFIVLALAAALLGGLGYAGYLGVQEIQRSNDSLLMRIEANEQNLNSLRDLVNAEFAEGDPEQQMQINQLQNEVEALTRQLEALQTVQSEDTAVQTDQIDDLEANLATAVAQNGDLAGELEMVQSALVALQSDLNSTGGRIDELGGGLDTLRLRLADLDESLVALTTETIAARDSEAAAVQQNLIQLQLWGLLTHARLALVDGDISAAETAVAQAIPFANSLTAEPDSFAAQALLRLQTRLTLAADGFATDLPMVAEDLEAASRELTLLIVGPPPEAEIVEETSPATETAVEATPAPTASSVSEETATPEPTAVPAETPLPSPTPTATP
ncbi:hypothetical protein [Candidatus Leptofilum sp.]|uniref:hypothetical protein n=1 Tax=Candidatus Leptofilum sp. TaxID=3241576 RepID=UPI003B59B0BA